MYLSQRGQLRPARHDVVIPLWVVGNKAGGAVLYPIGGVSEMSAAPTAKGVEGAVAEQAIEILRIGTGVAGEIFAVEVAEETVIMIHSMLLLRRDKLPHVREGGLLLVKGRTR